MQSSFLQGLFNWGPLGLGALYVGFNGLDLKDAFVWQGEWSAQPWGALFGFGIQRRSDLAQAKVLEIVFNKKPWQANFVLQKIDSEFISPLAATNKYTPNRRGWHLQLKLPLKKGYVSFNRRKHTNIEKTKTYNQLSSKLSSLSGKTEVEWRLEPTSALILRYLDGKTQVQIDLIRQSLRFDGIYRRADYRLSFDVPRKIARLELRFSPQLQWRIIGKRDFREKRSHYSLLIRKKMKNAAVQLEIGAYDRGNIYAGFNTPFKLGISWEWRF
ncbi:MAG: hypothetical protein GX335_04530 [Firmicutes bacterium]|nr:hypothetical protein [Bacillota bacterium]